MKCFKESEIVAILRRELEESGLTQRQWARENEVPEQIVSDFLNGRRGPNEGILNALGFDPEPTWRLAVTRLTPKKTPALDATKLAGRKAMAKDRGAKKKEAARVLGKREAGA